MKLLGRVNGVETEIAGGGGGSIIISPTLTLTVAGWDTSTLQQTVLYSHSTSLRNVIDVDPASVEEWAACGVIARYETVSNITFTCKSIPENALLFKVTSMGV